MIRLLYNKLDLHSEQRSAAYSIENKVVQRYSADRCGRAPKQWPRDQGSQTTKIPHREGGGTQVLDAMKEDVAGKNFRGSTWIVEDIESHRVRVDGTVELRVSCDGPYDATCEQRYNIPEKFISKYIKWTWREDRRKAARKGEL